MKRTWRLILSGLFVLILLALILAPGIARRYVINHSQKLIGRDLSIDKVRVNYFAGKVRITGLVLFEADGRMPFVSFDTLFADLKPLKLIGQELYLQQFYLSGLKAFVIQQDSMFNFSDLISKLAKRDASEAPVKDPAGEESFRYQLFDLELKNARFEYDNRNIGDTLLLQNISFSIPHIGWDQNDKSEAGLRLNLEKEGYLEAAINVNPAEGDFDMVVAMHQIGLEGFRKLVSTYADIGSVRGSFNTRLEIRGDFDQPQSSVVAGHLEFLDLALFDCGDKEFLGAGSIRINLQEMDPANTRFLIDSVIFEEPYFYFELNDSTNNFYQIFRLPPPDTTEVEPGEELSDSTANNRSSPFYYAIGSFRMRDGVIDFRDQSIGDPFNYHLSEIGIQTDSIESSSDLATIYASMLLNNRGELKAKAAFDPLTFSRFTLDYSITDFRLNDLNIYSRHFVGFPILYGEMFYKGHTEMVESQLVSDNHLILDHVELGEKRGGLMDLPLKLALYILKDRHDVIDLEVPVRGRTDDPTVSVGQIVWNTIKNLIIRTATAPYDYLSGLLGVDPEDIESINFEYGDTLLTDNMQKQLDLLLELEALKPDLEIELTYFNDLKREQHAILMKATGTDSVTVASLDPAAPQKLAADSLATLFSRIRISNMDQYLHTLRDSTKIAVLRSEQQDPMNIGSFPRFEVRYSMQDEELEQ